MRIYDEIARRRAAGGVVECDDVLWRIGELTDHLGKPIDLTEQENRDAFSDVLDAYVPDGFGLVLVPSTFRDCVADMTDGGKITFHGLLTSEQAAVATIERTLWLGRRYVEHHGLTVVPRYRANRIAPRSLVKCVGMYDHLGITDIHLRAAKSGSWYWAQWGFHFADREDLIRLAKHTQNIVEAFGADIDVSTFVHPQQFFYLGHPAEIRFHDLIDAFPRSEQGLQDIAQENGISLHQAIPFARAVLLTGPSWSGCLSLAPDHADRLIFDRVARKMVV
jgi:hypothetical protein